MKFVITAGHSNKDPGAVGNGAKEADLVRELRNVVALKLGQLGHTVVTDGSGNDNQDLNSAIRLIKTYKPDTAIEFHMNASSNASATGVETISLPKDKILAQKLSKAIADVLGLRLRGNAGWIDQSQSARGKLGYVDAGGLIVEVAFISNTTDLKAFQDKLWLVASAITNTLNTKD